ncbi:MAG: S8 family serine peptidase, partial [Acidobacteriota bacterium]
MSIFRGKRFGLLVLATLVVAAAASSWSSASKGDPLRSLRRGVGLSPVTYRVLPAYARPAEMAIGRMNRSVKQSEMQLPEVVHTRAGSFHLGAGRKDVQEFVLHDERGGARVREMQANRVAELGLYMLPARSRGQLSSLRESVEARGIKVVGALPVATLLVQATRGQAVALARSAEGELLRRMPLDLKLAANLGRVPMYQKLLAESRTYRFVARLSRDASVEEVVAGVPGRLRVGGSYRLADGTITLRGRTEDRGVLLHLARSIDVLSVADQVTTIQQMNAMLPSMMMTGHFNFGAVPMWDAGIDGGGDPGSGVAPQFVGVADDGLSLDTFQFSHNLTDPDLDPSNDTDPLQRPDVGAGHRKIESYRTAKEILQPFGIVAGGDFTTCDDLALSGGKTHGNTVTGAIAGNPSRGRDGLGIFRDNVDIFSNAPAQNMEETNLPLDGVARGARVIFQDAGNTREDNVACFLAGATDVDLGPLDPGALTPLLDEAVFRTDIGGTVGTLHERGARTYVIPWGVPNFDIIQTNGHSSYDNMANELDVFLSHNREVSVFVAVGNDGSDRSQPGELATNTLTDPIAVEVDSNNAATYQVTEPGTAKNAVVIGASMVDDLTLIPFDQTEDVASFSSKGPATFDSRRVAPTLVAPGRDRESLGFTTYFDSVATFRSNDNDQAGPIGLEVGDGRTTDFIDENNNGTSFSAAAAAGAGILARDYFAQGFYPSGERENPAIPTISGAMVKAILIASANFQDANLFRDRFNNEQGYGRIELMSALPLSNYPETLVPDPVQFYPALGDTPTTPLGLLVVDEFCPVTPTDLCSLDGTPLPEPYVRDQDSVDFADETERVYQVTVVDPDRELKVAVAWYDSNLEGATNQDLLNNDVDLVVEAPATTDSDGRPDTPEVDLVYRGNMFLGAYSATTVTIDSPANADAFRQPCDLTVTGRDVCNPSEAVLLHPRTFVNEDVGVDAKPGTGDAVPIGQLARVDGTLVFPPTKTSLDIGGIVVTELGEGDGVLNSEGKGGLNDAICVALQGSSADILALCTSGGVDLNADGDADDTEDANQDGRLQTQEGLPTGTWTIRVRGGQMAVQTPDLNTRAGVAVTQGGQNTAQPFALVVAGGFLPPGGTRIGLDRPTYDCSDSGLLRVADPAAGSPSALGLLSVQVLSGTGAVLDEETTFSFSQDKAGVPIFSAAMDVQRTETPIAGNGLVEVEDGARIVASYAGIAGSSQSSTTFSAVSCFLPVRSVPLALFGPDQRTVVVGGCDNDQFLDAGENLTYTVNLQHFTELGEEVQGLSMNLECLDGNLSTAADPCTVLSILDSPRRLDRVVTSEFSVEFPPGNAATFNLFVLPEAAAFVAANPDDRVLELRATLTAVSTDYQTEIPDPTNIPDFSFSRRLALQSDLEVFHYSTDYPVGTAGFVFRDLNRDGSIQTPAPSQLSDPGAGPLDKTQQITRNMIPRETLKF